jgi:phosphatidylserine/phosphatidylglycerophosphate/cardiolipin synthase-like enzyme
MVIDQEVAITDSFNFLKPAEQNNAENLLVIRSMDLSRVYVEN